MGTVFVGMLSWSANRAFRDEKNFLDQIYVKHKCSDLYNGAFNYYKNAMYENAYNKRVPLKPNFIISLFCRAALL